MTIRLPILLLLLTSNIAFAQTKEQLIKAINDVNSLDGWDGDLSGDIKNETEIISNNNYYNFKKLKTLISRSELKDLTNQPNQVLRIYAIRELIDQNDSSIDLKKIILEEIRNKRTIQVHEGCIVSKELTYSIIYHDYWNQVRLNSLKFSKKKNDKKREEIMLRAVNKDQKLRDINESILKLDQDVYWLIYDRLFEIEKYNDSFKKSIINLLFKNNNSYAFEYLRRNYKDEFATIYNEYFEKYFPNQQFDIANQAFYLYNLTKFAFDNDDRLMKKKILEKLRTTNGWKKELSGTFEMQIFKKYNIEL